MSEFKIEDGVVIDSNGNKATISRWGSEEKAQEALRSLTICSDCSGCSGCSRCSGCSDCSDCSGCSDCFDCFGCSDCSDCSDCSRCSGCSDCSDEKWVTDKREEKASAEEKSDGPLTFAGTVVPMIPDIHKAVYVAASQPDALNMGDWHTCSTTHCRAGWVVHLAGEAGYALEKATTTLFAAQMIYKASGSPISPVRFFDSNEKAMEDMKRLAEASK